MSNKSDFFIKLFAFSIPFTAFGIINTPDFGIDLALLLAIFFAGRYIIDRLLKRKIIVDNIDRLILLFLFTAFLSTIVAAATGPADIYRMFKQTVLLTIDCALFLYLKKYFKNNPKSLLACLKYYIFSACFVILFGLYQFLSGIFGLPYPHTLLNMAYNASLGTGKHLLIYDVPVGGIARIESIFGEPGWLALFLLGCIPLFYYLTKSSAKSLFKKQILNKIYFFLSIFIMLLTFSLAGYLGLCIMFIIFFLNSAIDRRFFKRLNIKTSKTLLPYLVLFIVVSISISFSNEKFVPKIHKILHKRDISPIIKAEYFIRNVSKEGKKVGHSSIAVLQTIVTTRNIVLHRPLFGAGYGNFANYFNLYAPSWALMNVNNIAGTGEFYRILSEMGLIGAVLFLCFFIVLLRKSHFAIKKVKDAQVYPMLKGVWLSLICYSINLLFVKSTNINSLQFWFLLSLVGAISTLKSNEKEENKT